MDIRRIVGFSEEEQASLLTAGKIVKEVFQALESGDATELDANSVELLTALVDMINKTLR